MEFSVAQTIFENVKGTRFCGIDSETKVSRLKRDEAVQPGTIMKVTKGSTVMVFGQDDPTAYANQVKRRMEAEGLDPDSWEVGPLSWGEHVPGTPFIKHTKIERGEDDGLMNEVTKYYLRVHFVNAGTSTYYIDGVRIDKKDIVDTSAPKKEGKQGGQDNKVIPRNYKLSSITAIRIDDSEFVV